MGLVYIFIDLTKSKVRRRAGRYLGCMMAGHAEWKKAFFTIISPCEMLFDDVGELACYKACASTKI